MNERAAVLPVEDLRRDFPILDQRIHGKPLVYLDNGATTQKPLCVLDAVRRFYERDNANVHRGIHELSARATDLFEAARERCAKFISSASEEIIFTRGTTEGINLVAGSLARGPLRAGDTVLVTQMEHHSNMVPWQLLAEYHGVRVEWLPIHGQEGRIDRDELVRLLDREPKLFAFTHISNTLGTINPVADFCALAKERGVMTLVDAAQSAGHMRLDVKSLGCDFLVCSGHKMCAPTGTGFLYGRQELLDSLPPYHGGGEMIDSVDYSGSTYKLSPSRFEAGTPNIGGAIGLAAAVDYLEKTGMDAIAAYDHELGQQAYDAIVSESLAEVIGPAVGRAGLVTFHVPGLHAHDLVTYADSQGIALRGGHHCNQALMRKLGYTATVRASFYFYNTTQEVEALLVCLRKAKAYFGL